MGCNHTARAAVHMRNAITTANLIPEPESTLPAAFVGL
jgi:hypothetical protein